MYSGTKAPLLIAAFLLIACGGVPSQVAAEETEIEKLAEPKTVTLVEFSSSGKRLGKVSAETVVKSESEWREQLSERAYDVTRRKGTEFAFTGKYNKNHEKGVYRCVACGNALFSSKTKYDSGSGWPSFWSPIAAENISTEVDRSLGVKREEILCTKCEAHLGHVFPDGPRPTGLRYCVNSAALQFEKAEKE